MVRGTLFERAGIAELTGVGDERENCAQPVPATTSAPAGCSSRFFFRRTAADGNHNEDQEQQPHLGAPP